MPHYVPNEYPNILGCHIFTEQISEYIWMSHNLPNEYPNIFDYNIFTKQISECIHTPEMAQI